mmetsp:Transcript_28853/g.62135  ORF Transcript_28853/g.62135 Transcript_28853/m.62135 type:complete len:253 (+) Transcript_28853:1351-2109(+)
MHRHRTSSGIGQSLFKGGFQLILLNNQIMARHALVLFLEGFQGLQGNPVGLDAHSIVKIRQGSVSVKVVHSVVDVSSFRSRGRRRRCRIESLVLPLLFMFGAVAAVARCSLEKGRNVGQGIGWRNIGIRPRGRILGGTRVTCIDISIDASADPGRLHTGVTIVIVPIVTAAMTRRFFFLASGRRRSCQYHIISRRWHVAYTVGVPVPFRQPAAFFRVVQPHQVLVATIAIVDAVSTALSSSTTTLQRQEKHT